MIIQVDSTGLFVGIVETEAPPPRGYHYLEVPENWTDSLFAPGVHRINNGRVVSGPPHIPDAPAPPPNIQGLVKALTDSPSIDSQTKQNLITALEGS